MLKLSVFRVSTIITHWPNSYELEIHQSCTGLDWNPFPLRHYGITRLVDVRLVLLHLPLKDAPQVQMGLGARLYAEFFSEDYKSVCLLLYKLYSHYIKLYHHPHNL